MRKSVAKKQFCFQVSEQLGALETPWSLTTKRIKRWELGSFWTHTFTPPGQHCLCLLSRFRFLWLFCVCRLDAGGLYIFWLQTQNSEGQQLYRAIYTGIQGLVTAELNLKGIHKRAVIISVSTAGTCKQVLLQLWLPLTPPTPLKKKREMYVQLGFFFFQHRGRLDLSGIFVGNETWNYYSSSSFSVHVCVLDVNECGTQLVRCDLNADCVNHFGSYSCLCRPGFLDKSRHGSGGTLCMDANDAGVLF